MNVVTHVGHGDDPDHPTGRRLSELTDAWHVFEEAVVRLDAGGSGRGEQCPSNRGLSRVCIVSNELSSSCVTPTPGEARS